MDRFKTVVMSGLLWCLFSITAFGGTTYYLDADNGSDGNSGRSPSQAWASFDRVNPRRFYPGDQILLHCGDTFVGKLQLDNDRGTPQNPIVIASYGDGERPMINAAGYLAGVYIANSDYIEVRDLEITADGGAPVDGSDPKKRYGILASTWGGGTVHGITIQNMYIHTIYPHEDTEHEGTNPTTYTGIGIEVKGQSKNPSQGLVVENCHFENLGFKVLAMHWLNDVRILNNHMANIGGPAMVPGRCNDLLVEGNVVDGSGAYTDPRMHGRGSGIWPYRCERVLIQKNAFMHARGRYDSCGAHIDIGCKDVVVQYNLSMDNAGGFVEILGENENCAYRYNISINDGHRVKSGPGTGDGHVLLFSGHNGKEDRAGPYNSYVYNNTIYVKDDQHCSFSIEGTTDGVLIANNLFYIEGPAEDGTPSWWGKYPEGISERVIWTNNLYQRGGIFPKDWPFVNDTPMYGNPNLSNPGGLTAEDYMPLANAFVEGRGIEIPKIPGDNLGLRIGLKVTEDYFGNSIQGLPDIGAVELGGSVSTSNGAAFADLIKPESYSSVLMTAMPGPARDQYYFTEVTGNEGGDDSGWQSEPTYRDEGLLPGTHYAYTVTVKGLRDRDRETSAVAHVNTPVFDPYLERIVLDEDFSSKLNPENTETPYPVSTWYCSNKESWSAEGQPSSVQAQGGGMRVGWGYDEVVLQYYSDKTWDLNRDYEFTGDWEIENVLTKHLGLIVGVGEYDPATGEMLQRIKEMTAGELTNPTIGQSGSFSLIVSAAELQATGVSSSSHVGVFLHHDNDDILYEQTSVKSDVYRVDNLLMLAMTDAVNPESLLKK